MKYEDARLHILDGDIISVKKAHSLFGYLTKFFTGKYTHTGIAVWLDAGLWMVELNGGRNHAIPMSQLADSEFDVFLPPPELDRSDIRTSSLESLRVMVPYGFFATIAVGINEFFGFNRFIHWRDHIECAGYVVRILELSGWSEHSYVISPTKFTELLKFKLSVSEKD